MVLIRCDEVEKILANGIVNMVVFEQKKVRFVLRGLTGHHTTEMTEMLRIFLLQTVINLLKSLAKV